MKTLGGTKVLRVEPHDGISTLLKETPESSLAFFPPCEDIARVFKLEEGSHYNLIVLAL